MTDAYVYDHVRSPRGRGRANGSLHEVTPVDLTSQVLGSLRDRNELDTSRLDDVVLGCVSPVGEQGSVIARPALLNADYAEVLWDGDYRIPKDVGGDVCEYPLARNLVLAAVALGSEAIVRYLVEGQQESLALTLGDFSITRPETIG